MRVSKDRQWMQSVLVNSSTCAKFWRPNFKIKLQDSNRIQVNTKCLALQLLIIWTCHSTQIELIVYYTLSSCCKSKAALLKFRSCMHLHITTVYWSPVQLQMDWCRWPWSTNIDPLSVKSTGHLPRWAFFLVVQILKGNLPFDTCLVMVSKMFVKYLRVCRGYHRYLQWYVCKSEVGTNIGIEECDTSWVRYSITCTNTLVDTQV